MHHVLIYRPSKTAMQSGRAKTQRWVLEFQREVPKGVFPLMGWTSQKDMNRQIRLAFPTKESAIEYAKKHGLTYCLQEPNTRRTPPKRYADNFRSTPII